jgi:hypothetical protein
MRLSETLDPNANMSRQLSDEPSRTIPYVDIVDPILRKERKLILEPSANASKQLSDEPNRTIP